jgi:hypothetical protein
MTDPQTEDMHVGERNAVRRVLAAFVAHFSRTSPEAAKRMRVVIDTLDAEAVEEQHPETKRALREHYRARVRGRGKQPTLLCRVVESSTTAPG